MNGYQPTAMGRHQPTAINQQGFTLIEALIALALLALLGLASALALNSAMRNQEQFQAHQQQLEHLQRSQLLLSRDLEQALVRQGRDSLGNSLEQAFIAYPEADSSQQGLLLHFFKTGRRLLGTTPGSHLEQVRYRLEGEQLIRETTAVLDPSGAPDWHSSRLLDNVEDLKLSFFQDNRWHNQWPPLTTETETTSFNAMLPEAIAIELFSPVFEPIRQLILLPEVP